MQIACSANRTARLWRSASEYTATVGIPRSLQAQMMRSAISPRLAIRILSKGADAKELFSVLYRLSIRDEFGLNHPGHVRLDLVHELHRFDDAENLADPDMVAHFYKGRAVGNRTNIIGPHIGRRHVVQRIRLFCRRSLRLWSRRSRSRSSGRREVRSRHQEVALTAEGFADANAILAALHFQLGDPRLFRQPD